MYYLSQVMTPNKIGTTNFYNIDRGQCQHPHSVFSNIYQESNSNTTALNSLTSIGWSNIMSQIINTKNELNHFASGELLSEFATNYINKVANIKLPLTILERGTECLKQLTEITIDKTPNISDAQKNDEKKWWRLFLDIWKEQTKEDLKKENLLLE